VKSLFALLVMFALIVFSAFAAAAVYTPVPQVQAIAHDSGPPVADMPQISEVGRMPTALTFDPYRPMIGVGLKLATVKNQSTCVGPGVPTLGACEGKAQNLTG